MEPKSASKTSFAKSARDNAEAAILPSMICCCRLSQQEALSGGDWSGGQSCHADLSVVEDVVAAEGPLLRLAHLPDLAVGRRRKLRVAQSHSIVALTALVHKG